MDKRVSIFHDYFDNWDIRLSDKTIAALKEGQVVQIVQAGWTIKVLFDEDEESPYMDFYATHRMTNDRHTRVRRDGTVTGLPALPEGRRVAPDPEEDAQLEREFQAYSRRVMDELNTKGFGINGQEHMSFQIKAYLHGVIPGQEPKSEEEPDTRAD